MIKNTDTIIQENEDIIMARRIASAVKEAGGRTYYVGGFVRDGILGRENKDVDIEIHGITIDALKSILDSLGERIEMGASFGIMGLRHYGIDVCLPRIGASSGGELETYIDPFTGEQNAARHRDFTMNALMQDVLSGKILDHFGGCEDIENRVIRHVDNETFGEDPLRVLRAAQFAARFDFSVADETIALASKINIDEIACERVMGELEKALLKSERPSLFFGNLKEMDHVSIWFPEVQALCGLEQPVYYHPEGDVWRHTMQVLDAAAEMRKDAEKPLWFMLSALCHDFGKPEAYESKDGSIHFYDHESKGIAFAKRFLERIAKDIKLKDYVLNMVKLHMRPNMLVDNGAGTKSYMYMFDEAVSTNDLLLLAKADHIGRAGTDADLADLKDSYLPVEQKLKDMLRVYKERMSEPYLTGEDLIKAGFQPGPKMGETLKQAHKLRLAGRSKEEQFKNTIWIMNKEDQ